MNIAGWPWLGRDLAMEWISAPQEGQAADLHAIALHSPILATILDRWADISLPDCWLVAGALAQTVWNDAFDLPPTHGISDVDLVYFDADDLSEEAEARHSTRVRELFSDLSVRIDVKNEARVHLWYKAKSGYAIQPYTSTTDAITTFPTTATAIGIQPRLNELRLFTPYGLSDLFGLIVRPNKKQIMRPVYDAKVARWLALWPRLHVVPWDAEPL
jgi:hypothetical protein